MQDNHDQYQSLFWSLSMPLKYTGLMHNDFAGVTIGTGIGKNLQLQEMMLSMLSLGGKIFVLDYDGSLKNFCEILRGQYISFDPAKPISINPFSSLSFSGVSFENDKFSAEARDEFLASVFAILAHMVAANCGTTDLQQKILKRALAEVWEKQKNDTQIDDIASWLNSQPEFAARELGRMLFDYTTKGAYGAFFTGDAAVDLNADIIMIETEHLRNSPDLMVVIIQTMLARINHSLLKSNISKPSLIIINEQIQALGSKSAGGTGMLEQLKALFTKNVTTEQVTEEVLPQKPVTDIGKVTKIKEWSYDPTYIQEEAINYRKSVIPAGTKVNLLENAAWGMRLLFIDGEVEEQVAWASTQEGRVMLVGGGIHSKLAIVLGREAFSDQSGVLQKRYNIKNVPAIVEQEGAMLSVKEIKILRKKGGVDKN
jgi:hypothetical protein